MGSHKDNTIPVTKKLTTATTHVVWQGSSEDQIPEPALIIEVGDVLVIEQEDRYITVNYETVKKLSEILKKVKAVKK